MPAAWPTTTELSTRLTEDGFTSLPSTATLQAALDTGKGNWEEETGFIPFLASGAHVARYFDPPGPPASARNAIRGGGRVLHLQGGFAALTHIKVNGVAYTAGTDCYLRPNNAALKLKPYTSIEFITDIWGMPQCIEISAQWGWWTTIPANAWEAVMQEAKYLLAPTLLQKASVGASRIKQGPVEVEYGEGKITRFVTGLQSEIAKRIAQQYIQIRL